MPRAAAALLLLALPRALGLQVQEGEDPAPADEEGELKYSTVTGPASGDPKVLGLYGKRFQIHRPGDHPLIVVPNAKRRRGSLLDVTATVKELEIGDPCLLFIKNITLTGSWLGGTTVQVRAQGTGTDFALKVDPKKHNSPWKPFKNMTGWEEFIHKDAGSGMVTTVKGVIGRREGHSEDIKGPFEHRFLFRVGTEDQKAKKKFEIDVAMPQPGRQYLTIKVSHVNSLGDAVSKSLRGLMGLDSKAVTESYETHNHNLQVRQECKDSVTGTKASELLALSGGLSRAIAHWE